jgi:microcystin-dependent protein
MATTPYNNLTLPDPSVTPGIEWATELNAAITTIDAHDHSPGKGVLVPTTGLNINADLSINSNAVTDVKNAAFTSQAASLPTSIVSSVYVINGDLWYNNSAGVAVQLTAGSSITSASSPLVPSGVVWEYAGISAPTGFLLCDGSAVSRTTYASLFAAIGTNFGVGDGATTFNLPDHKGRTGVGAGTYTDTVSGSITRTLGTKLGAEKHVMLTNEMPLHTHTDSGHTHGTPFQNSGVSGGAPAGFGTAVIVGGTNTTSANAAIQNTGGDLPHNNMQPSLVVNYIIKT